MEAAKAALFYLGLLAVIFAFFWLAWVTAEKGVWEVFR